MVPLLQLGNMRFVVHTDDHEPAHVPVYGEGEARIDLVNLKVISNRRMSKRDLSVALAIIGEQQTMFLESWRRIHG